MARFTAIVFYDSHADIPVERRLRGAQPYQSIAISVGTIRRHTPYHLDLSGRLDCVCVLDRSGEIISKLLVPFHFRTIIETEFLNISGSLACDNVQSLQHAPYQRLDRFEYRKYLRGHVRMFLLPRH